MPMLNVPVEVMGLPVIVKMPEDDPPLTVCAALVTVPDPVGLPKAHALPVHCK